MSANSPLLPGDQTPSKAEATLLMPIFTGSGTSPFTTHVIPSPTASQSSAPNVAALPDSEDEVCVTLYSLEKLCVRRY